MKLDTKYNTKILEELNQNLQSLTRYIHIPNLAALIYEGELVNWKFYIAFCYRYSIIKEADSFKAKTW